MFKSYKVKNIIRDSIFLLISWFGIYRIFRKKNASNVLIMVYHDVMPKEYLIKDNYNYNTTIYLERFEKQIKYLSKYYNPITLDQFIDWLLKNKSLPQNPVLLTFDDGHKNLYDYAVPIIEKYGFKGVFFVNTGCLGKTVKNICEKYISQVNSNSEGRKMYNMFRNLTYDKQIELISKLGNKISEKENLRYNYMSLENCKDLIRRGHTIQSHSVNHYILSTLDNSMSFSEINDSKKFIENNIDVNITSIAYPFGDPKYDFFDREKEYAKKTGYILGFSGEWWCKNGIKRSEIDNFSIPRFGDVNRPFEYFKYLISGYRLPL